MRRGQTGYSFVELVFITTIVITLCGIAVPEMLTGIDDFRTAGAAHYVETLLHRARMEAVMRSSDVAMQFVVMADGHYAMAMHVDGNRNGVLTREIQSGVDRQLVASTRLVDNFADVDFGALPGLPAVDSGGTPPGSDPIRLGSSTLATFTAIGTSTTGSLYIRGNHGAQYVVRIYGQTGKTRILKYHLRTGQWKPL